MKLRLGRVYQLRPKNRNAWELQVLVESRSEQLNYQTGQIIPVKELDDSVAEVLTKLDGKLLDDVSGLSYIPNSLELIVIRIWEWLEEAISYQARLVKIRLTERNDFFVEYAKEQLIQPMTCPQPQLKRKERKK